MTIGASKSYMLEMEEVGMSAYLFCGKMASFFTYLYKIGVNLPFFACHSF